MPSVMHNPRLEDPFILRPPELTALTLEEIPPAVYSEEQMRLAREEAERSATAAARASFDEELARMESRCAELAGDLLGAIGAVARERVALLEAASQEVVDLALLIARRVLRRSIEGDPAAAVPLVRELLQRTAAASAVVVRLAPRDHACVMEQIAGGPEAAGLEGLRLRTDTTIAPGGCVLETEAGSLDARLETQMERIEAALRGGEEAP